ncbi:MAG: hypothetical protein H8Z69_05350 [Nanohaloarchaea archaeon]|nr:hypothetical protein [Candidatus Nanohaloarchaea archaeon]
MEQKTALNSFISRFSRSETASDTANDASIPEKPFSEYTEKYNLNEYESNRLEIASQAGVGAEEALKFALPQETAEDILQTEEGLEESGNPYHRGFSDEEMRIALEGFYDEWMTPEEIADKVADRSPYNRTSPTIRGNLEKIEDIDTPSPAAVSQQEERVEEAEGQEARFRYERVDFFRDGRDYVMRQSIPTGDGLRNDTKGYEVLDEIDDEELVAWLYGEGLDEQEIVTAVIANTENSEITESEVRKYRADADISDVAEEVLESKKDRDELSFV